jgi:hypothetical protein
MAVRPDYTDTSHEYHDPNAEKREPNNDDIESKNRKIDTFISVLEARLGQEMTEVNKNEIEVLVLRIRDFMDKVIELGGKPNYNSILDQFNFADIAAMHDRNSSNSTKQTPESDNHQDDVDDYENEDREQQNSNYGHREPDVDQSYKNKTNYQTQENYTNFSRTDVINELNIARKSKNIQEIIRLTKILSKLK